MQISFVAFAVIIMLHCRADGFGDQTGNWMNLFEGQNIKFPRDWVERCGDANGNITIFYESYQTFTNCFNDLFNMTTLVGEFSIEFEAGRVANFTKYQCRKLLPLQTCITTYVQSIHHCFNATEKENVWTLVRMIRALMDFVCFKDGERVLIFLKDGGLECVMDEDVTLKLKQCSTIDKLELKNETVQEVNIMAQHKFDEKNCRRMNNYAACIFNATKTCKDRTPSLIIDALSTAVLKETPCYVSGSLAMHNDSYFLLILLTFASFLYNRVCKIV